MLSSPVLRVPKVRRKVDPTSLPDVRGLAFVFKNFSVIVVHTTSCTQPWHAFNTSGKSRNLCAVDQ